MKTAAVATAKRVDGKTSRDPQGTRERLLRSAFEQIHRLGFNNTDLDAILSAAGVTKGALYHHFENKEALGYAIVEEIIATICREKWITPLEMAADPLQTIIHIVRSTPEEHVSCGCPLNNLALEMSPLDEGFRTRIAKVFDDWRASITSAFHVGQQKGVIRADVDPKESAIFVIALYEGYLSLAKSSQDVRVLQAGKKAIANYLESLRLVPGK